MTDQTKDPQSEDNQSEDKVEISKKEYDEMVEKIALGKQDKANLISEIKELREKKQISESEAEELRKKAGQSGKDETPSEGITPEKIEEQVAKTVSKILQDRDSKTAEENMKSAMRAFQSKNKQFHPDNDEAGLKMSALEKKLARFNLSGLKSESEFLEVFEDAKRLVMNEQPAAPKNSNPNPIAPDAPAPVAKEEKDDELTSEEMKIVERTFGGDKDRYKKIRSKRPEYVAELLRYAR